jgi:hypothetical protein
MSEWSCMPCQICASSRGFPAARTRAFSMTTVVNLFYCACALLCWYLCLFRCDLLFSILQNSRTVEENRALLNGAKLVEWP